MSCTSQNFRFSRIGFIHLNFRIFLLMYMGSMPSLDRERPPGQRSFCAAPPPRPPTQSARPAVRRYKQALMELAAARQARPFSRRPPTGPGARQFIRHAVTVYMSAVTAYRAGEALWSRGRRDIAARPPSSPVQHAGRCLS